MALIRGYTTKYKCKTCGGEVLLIFDPIAGAGKTIKIRYKHTIDGIMFQNGIPYSCKKNGESINDSEVEKIDVPIIESDYRSRLFDDSNYYRL